MAAQEHKITQGQVEFWYRVREYRLRSGIDQRDFAKRLGISQSSLSLSERFGFRGMLTRNQVLELSNILKLNPIEQEEMLSLGGYLLSEEFVSRLIWLLQYSSEESFLGYTRADAITTLGLCLQAIPLHRNTDEAAMRAKRPINRRVPLKGGHNEDLQVRTCTT